VNEVSRWGSPWSAGPPLRQAPGPAQCAEPADPSGRREAAVARAGPAAAPVRL